MLTGGLSQTSKVDRADSVDPVHRTPPGGGIPGVISGAPTSFFSHYCFNSPQNFNLELLIHGSLRQRCSEPSHTLPGYRERRSLKARETQGATEEEGSPEHVEHWELHEQALPGPSSLGVVPEKEWSPVSPKAGTVRDVSSGSLLSAGRR